MSQASKLSDSLTAVVKMALQSRPTGIDPAERRHDRLVIMGNGPSLRDVIDRHPDVLRDNDTMAVNFAANTREFFEIQPRFYMLADPHFFNAAGHDPNVDALIDALNRVDWVMTLFVPRGAGRLSGLIHNTHVRVARYNAVGIEGWSRLTRLAFDMRLAMPRPRNVLIPAIMTGVWLGYPEIYLAGADHSWTRSLGVDDDNRVITNLPHYYAEDSRESERIRRVYADIPLHALFLSYYTAFKAYHEIEPWARRRGTHIYNVSPGSFIDAFERKVL